MIRLQAGYYQDLCLGQVYAVAKQGSKWSCQWERGAPWTSGFATKRKAAAHAEYMIAMHQRNAKRARQGYQTLDAVRVSER